MAKFKPPQELIDEGFIRFQTDEETGLRIYNYTEQAQYQKKWNEWTLQSRGIIVDKDDNVVARPFDKFFNYEEHQGPLPDGTPDVYHKMDGSLGILYWYGDKWRIATRGSFNSDQAVMAKNFVKADTLDLDKGYTHLFEIIYPENRIVIDYQDFRGLVYLYSRNIETGEYSKQVPKDSLSVEQVEFTSFDNLKQQNTANKEGYVLVWPNGFRLKIKFEEYVRLHRIITGVSEKTIWEYISEGKPLDDLINKVPDEFHKWVSDTVLTITDKWTEIVNQCSPVADEMKKLDDRKAIAENVKNHTYPGIVFAMIDGKDWQKMVWKLVKPTKFKQFKTEI